jgi:hypothetical protein
MPLGIDAYAARGNGCGCGGKIGCQCQDPSALATLLGVLPVVGDPSGTVAARVRNRPFAALSPCQLCNMAPGAASIRGAQSDR